MPPVAAARVVDLSNLTAINSFFIQGGAAADEAGFSVSSAGDVKGDGISDLIIGAPGNDCAAISADAAYVIYGVAGSTHDRVDLSALDPSDGFTLFGDTTGDYAGWSLSSAGDANGDGIDDLIIGAFSGDICGIDACEAYVVYGVPTSARGPVDLFNLNSIFGFTIQGDVPNDIAGLSVSGAGDANGDGSDDLIAGARGGDDGGSNAGEAYVIYRVTGTTRATVDLTGLAASDGFIIRGDAAEDLAGFSVSGADDVNGDGIADLIVGAPYGDNGDDYAGEAYVIYGKAGTPRGTVDLTGLAASDVFIIQGDAAYDIAGWSVSSAGDVNGDGIDDLIVGARLRDDGGYSASEAYLIFGVAGATRGTLDLTGLTASEGFIIQGDEEGDGAGDGGDGADSLDGGAGIDTADCSRAAVTVTVSLLTGTGTQGEAAGDVLAGIERLAGSAFADNLTGNTGVNLLRGGAGADTMDGGAGTDTFYYRTAASGIRVDLFAGTGSLGDAAGDVVSGFEVVFGSAFDDTVTGNASANRIRRSARADIIDGGAGSDTLDYVTSGAAVTVNLLTVTGLFGDAEGDMISGIERVIDSRFDDVLTGNALRNFLGGGAGDDVMNGGGGNDVFLFGAGDDSINGDDGIDVAPFIGNQSEFTMFDFAPGNWTVTQTSTGDTDTLTSIETLRFSDGDFLLIMQGRAGFVRNAPAPLFLAGFNFKQARGHRPGGRDSAPGQANAP